LLISDILTSPFTYISKIRILLSFIRLLFLVFILASGCKRTPSEKFNHIIKSEQSSPDGTKIVAWDDGQKIRQTNIYNKAYEIAFTTENPTEQLDSIVATADNYNKFKAENVSVTNVKTLDINLIPTPPQKVFWLYGETSSPAGATAAVYDDGNELDEATINDNTYRTKDLNLPTDNKIDSVVVNATGYNKIVYTNVPINENGNKFEITLNLTTYDHWFSNNTSTPGAHADWYKNGNVVMTADVDAEGDYVTNKWTTTNTSEVADSIVATATGFNKRKLIDVQVNEGNNDLQLDLSAIIYQYKFVGNNTMPNGANIEAWENGENIASGVVSGTNYATGNWQSTLTNMNIDSVLFTAAGHEKKKFVNVAVVPGENVLNAQLTQITFSYRLVSSNSSPDGTTMQAWEAGENIANATIAGTNYTSNQWTSTLSSMNIDSIVFKKTGYIPQKFVNVATIPGDNTQDANLNPVSYNYTVALTIASSNASKTPLGFRGAILIGADTAAVSNFTGTNGQLVFTNASPTLNAKAVAINIPYHADAPAQNVALDGDDNFNFVADADVSYFNVSGNVSDENTTPVSANVSSEGKNDDTDANGDYSIQNIERNRDANNKPLSYSIDVIATGGFDTQTKQETVDGTNKIVNFVTPINKNTYTLDLIITEETGDNLLIGKTINIKEPDGDIQQKTITGKHTAITIQGPYDNNKKAKIWLSSDSEYDGLTGTINQNLKAPLTSVYDPSETRQDTLAVIIGDVNNKTAYVSFMSKNTRDNELIRELVANDGGNTEWNYYNAQGEREKTYIIVQTSKQGTPVPAEIQQWYQDAITIHNHYLTAQGLQILKTNTETQTTYPTAYIPGKIFLLVDNSMPAPSNAKIGNYPETYNRGDATIRESDGRGTAISETWGVEAGKEYNPNVFVQFTLSGGDVESLNDLGFKAFRIIQMYKGLTIPDPTP